jgi:hypothetical protein
LEQAKKGDSPAGETCIGLMQTKNKEHMLTVAAK